MNIFFLTTVCVCQSTKITASSWKNYCLLTTPVENSRRCTYLFCYFCVNFKIASHFFQFAYLTMPQQNSFAQVWSKLWIFKTIHTTVLRIKKLKILPVKRCGWARNVQDVTWYFPFTAETWILRYWPRGINTHTLGDGGTSLGYIRGHWQDTSAQTAQGYQPAQHTPNCFGGGIKNTLHQSQVVISSRRLVPLLGLVHPILLLALK